MQQAIVRTATTWEYIKEIKYILMENADVLMHPSECTAFISILPEGVLCHPDIAEEMERPGTTFDMQFVESEAGSININVTAHTDGEMVGALEQVLFINFVESIIASTQNLVSVYQFS